MSKHTIQLTFFLALIGGVALLSYFIFRPYLMALFLAVVFAVAFAPLYRTVLSKIPKWPNIASFISVGIVLFLILLPITMFVFLMFQEASNLYASYQTNGGNSGALASATQYAENTLRGFMPGVSVDLAPERYVQELFSWGTKNIGSVFTGTINFVIGLFVMLFALFFLFRDGQKLRTTIIHASPLTDSDDEGILLKLERAVNSVVRGSLLVALFQGILAGIGFAVTGIPNPALWGFVAVLAALIPTVGTAIVVIPAVLYLYFTSHAVGALFLLLWGVLAVGLIDNVLRPFLIERGMKVHTFIIFLAVLGGISFFGPIGLIAGPVAISLLFSLVDIYPAIVQGLEEAKIEEQSQA